MSNFLRLDEVAEIIMGQSPDSNKCNQEGKGLGFLQGCAEFGKYYPDVENYCTEPKKIAPSNSILISVRAPVGAVNITKEKLVIGRGLAAIFPTKSDLRYIYYSIINDVRQLKVVSQGSTFLAINSEDLRSFLIRDYPKPQQTKIAKILTTIDNVIEKTEEAIGKYEAIKQGMMHDLFTRGIGEDGQLRPSFEEAPELYKESALGWIPKEWEVDIMDNIIIQMTNGFVGVATPYYVKEEQDGVIYLFGNNIRADKIELKKYARISNDFHIKHGKSQLKEGDLLTVQSGHIGTSAVVPKDFPKSNCHALIITRFKNGINPFFISYYINSPLGMNRFEPFFVGSTIKHVNVKEFKEYPILKINKNEQDRIVKKIQTINSQIDNEKQILSKQTQLKKGLMQDLLTGKVVVNG